MEQKDLRTYHRRGVTRESGYHTCNETTGGECVILHACRYVCNSDTVTFVFSRDFVSTVELFERGISILAFGGYLHSVKKATVSLKMSFCYEGETRTFDKGNGQVIESNSWSNIGMHAEQLLNKDSMLADAVVKMVISTERGNILDFIAFDFGTISKEEFQDTSCAKSFYQKWLIISKKP